MPFRASQLHAELLGMPLFAFPGNHFGYMDFPPKNNPRWIAERLHRGVVELGQVSAVRT